MQRRERYVVQSLGKPLTEKVKESRVLLVGAGGIGCELLKNLVCCGFGSGLRKGLDEDGDQENLSTKRAGIVVVDLDTIDLSNLNRQFLFRKQHIKKPKAFVAKETASQFNPSVNINAQHASIFDSQYDVEFFESFDIVFNALDNLAARRHVNRMCLAADVPLIESGTTGFNGQVQAIRKSVTECYDCNEKPVQKSFPICTIRSTPSQPIHCIVWAKSYLLPELFGTSEEDSTDMTETAEDNAEEVAKLREEAAALKNVRSLMGKSEFAQEIFNKVFHDDIERLRSMTEMWQSRKAPDPLRFESVLIDPHPVKQGQELASQDQSIWTLLDNLKVFCYAVDVLSKRVQAGETAIEFDKDDKDTLDFVAASANLRAEVFGISPNSEWDIKQMAGNIIPAIATSNALTASLCAMQAFKVLRSSGLKAPALAKPTASNHLSNNAESTATNGKVELPLGGSKMVFLTSKNTERLISTENLRPARVDCPVCSPYYGKIYIKEGSSPTLQQLVDLLESRLNYEDFSITSFDAKIIYDPDFEDNLAKPLKDYGIGGGGIHFLTITDDSDEPKVDLVLSATVSRLDGEDELVLSPADMVLQPKPRQPRHKMETNGIVTSASEPESDATVSAKRKREAEDEEPEGFKKKAKADEPVYVVEDDGAITLD